ncbi:LAMI_0E14334g1_1 [Lachancea mirantina]|uniref:LAMI_0E14334g1_1 n=1 Tax=Lachancea mirantina TaxID=1230905 RepID=A0A1G4JRI5_9SACH|nr:LAMI_0E14334g1_1 [Lachancea mirantina]
MSANPFQNIGKNAAYLCGFAILSVLAVKAAIRGRRDAQFDRFGEKSQGRDDYYKNLANVRPGFPISQADDGSGRKSDFQGSGLSYLSRKRGDKLGFWDRRRDE